MKERIINVLLNPNRIFIYASGLKIFKIVPDKLYLKTKFRLIMGKKLDLKNPATFNEKLQWLKLYDRKPEYKDLVDKYKVREYISNTIGEEYLIPLLGIYNSFDEIDFNTLPNQFVLKPNHTSGNVYVCRDKNSINYTSLKEEVNKWMKREYYWVHREWCYKNIEPKIICEKYMVDESGYELKDYKFMSFNGRVMCSFIGLNRNSVNGLNVDFYDMEWNKLPFERHYPRSETIIEKPLEFEKMVKFAEMLSKKVPFLRVDFYEVNGNLYFGELTFYPGSGFEKFSPQKYDYEIGSWLRLPPVEDNLNRKE